MRALNWCKKIAILPILLLIGFNAYAGEEHFIKARTLQRNGEYDKAIEAYKEYLIKPIAQSEFNEKELFYYTEALVQLMNTYQSNRKIPGYHYRKIKTEDKSEIIEKMQTENALFRAGE